jgi:uncharacterized SAM-binding protein YcdF (DUF218 family)
MLFVLSKLFWYVASPGNFCIILVVLGTLLLVFSRRRRGLGSVALGAFGLTIVTVLPISTWAITPLENRFPQSPNPVRLDGIVVLGGSVNPVVSLARHQVSIQEASERLFETVSLAQRYPSARIIVSGGDSSIVPNGNISEAKVMRDALTGMGIASDRIQLEDKSRNTYENALNSFKMAAPQPGETWLLVTSGWHMPRAMGCFRVVGWQTIVAHPVDYRTTGMPESLSTFTAVIEFSRLSTAAKEWIGLAVYRLLGRTDSLFPAPMPANS